VERFNLYLKNNFYKPLKAKLKNSGLEIDKELLNSYLSPWLIKANNRIHSTTKEKLSVLLEKEKCYLISLGNIVTKTDGLNIKENDKNNNKTNEIKKILSIEITNENLKKIEESLNIDISYFSNLTDYEDLIYKDEYAE
jgi:hypothetical protein